MHEQLTNALARSPAASAIGGGVKLSGPVRMPEKKQHITLLHQGKPEQREEINRLLADRLKYEVLIAQKGEDICSAIRAGRAMPDAILVDMDCCPSGDKAVTEIMGLKQHIPVIVLVGYGDYQQAAESLLLGACDFITKPFAEQRIAVTLRNAIALEQARRIAVAAINLANNPHGQGASSDALISLVGTAGEVCKMQDIEKAAIHFALKFYNGRMSEVAKKLGIGRSTLYRKLESFARA